MRPRLMGVASLAIALAACVASLPRHAYPFDPSDEFIAAAERGCERESEWGGFHSTPESRFAGCMAGMGVKRGRARGLPGWSPPDGADGPTEMQDCANAALTKAAHLDSCMDAAGFSSAPDQIIPYRRPGQKGLRESRDQLRHCMSDSARRIDRFDREYGECLRMLGWEWHWR